MKTWWFLENSDGAWLENAAHGTFTRDPNEALKWENRAWADHFRGGLRHPLWTLRPTEHAWVGDGEAIDWKARAQAAEAETARLSALLDQARARFGALIDAQAPGPWEVKDSPEAPFDGMFRILGAFHPTHIRGRSFDDRAWVAYLEKYEFAVWVAELRNAAAAFLTRLSKTGGEEKQGVSLSRTSPSSPDRGRPEALSDLEWRLTFDELEDLHSAVAGVVTERERWVPDAEQRWERLEIWLTRLAEACNERFPAHWKGLPPAPAELGADLTDQQRSVSGAGEEL